jgi:hemoglobin/transferrin/lactoferrin receptor protein
VLVKINGQPIPDHSTYGSPLLIDVNMIDKIEVVRGSASVVHGSNAIGGVVNITTRKAQAGEQQVLLGAGYYSATRGYRASAGVMGAAKSVDWRLQAAQAEFGDRRTPDKIASKPLGKNLVNTHRLVDSDSEQKSISAELGYRVDDRQRLAWQGDYFKQSANAWMAPVENMDMSLGFPKRDSTRNALNYSFDDDNAKIHAVHANLYYQTGTRIMDNTSNVDIPAKLTPPPTPAIKSDSFSRSHDDLMTQGAQLNFASRLLGDNITLLGFEYQKDALDVDKTTTKTTYRPAPLPAITTPAFSNQQAEQSFWSVFVQQQIQLVNALEANLGARYYNIESKLEKSTERTPSKQSDDQLVGSASLVWQTSDISSLRLNVAQGYTYPSLTQQFSATPGNGAMNYGNPDLKAEEATTYELGARVEGKQLSMDATLYYSQAQNFIDKRRILASPGAYTSDSKCELSSSGKNQTYCFEWFNAQKADTTGIELMLAYRIDAWRPYLNVSAQERELIFGNGVSTWSSGLPLYQARAGLEWQMLSNFDWDFYVRSYGKSKREDFNSKGDPVTKKTHSYAEFNLAAYYQATKNLSVSAAALNLTNKSYQNPDELPAAQRALDVEVNWKF